MTSVASRLSESVRYESERVREYQSIESVPSLEYADLEGEILRTQRYPHEEGDLYRAERWKTD